jgi:murein DD-endopeptidase MepM/ murein hydrolase activator NlpD
MARRAVVAVLAVLFLAAPAASDPGSEKERLDARIDELRDRIEAAGAQEGVLTSELTVLNSRVRTAQAVLNTEQAQLTAVEQELVVQAARRQALDRQVSELRERLTQLRREESAAVVSLERRVREIYMADEPDPVAFMFGAASFGDLIDTIELLDRIGRQDERIVQSVTRSRQRIADAAAVARAARAEARVVEREIEARVAEQHAIRDRLAAGRDALAAAESGKEAALGTIRENKEHFTEEVEVLEEESAALGARIRAAQEANASSGPAPVANPGGLAWPVSGPVVSGFGPRGGRLHEGIDIIAASGTPVRASASGVVIHAGWLGGYGLLVVVDHGGGLSTAYAHNSSLARGVGSQVSQGDVIAYVGSTGNSSGPHVHFEVRVNGTAVDPMGYL